MCKIWPARDLNSRPPEHVTSVLITCLIDLFALDVLIICHKPKFICLYTKTSLSCSQSNLCLALYDSLLFYIKFSLFSFPIFNQRMFFDCSFLTDLRLKKLFLKRDVKSYLYAAFCTS